MVTTPETTTIEPVQAKLRLEFSERRLFLRLGDVAMIVAGGLFGLAVWSTIAGYNIDGLFLRDHIGWLALIGGCWLSWLFLADLVDLKQAVRIRSSARRIVLGSFVIGSLYVAYFFVRAVPLGGASESGVIPPLRLAPGVAIISTAILLIVWRMVYALLFLAPHLRRRVLILGAGAAGNTMLQALKMNPHFDVVGLLDDDPEKHGQAMQDAHVIGGVDSLRAMADRHGFDELVVAISAGVSGDLFQTIVDCHERGIAITPMPLLYEQLTGRIAVEHIGSQWYVALPFAPHATGPLYRLAKRVFDLAIGCVLFAVFLVVLGPVAILIQIDGRGRVFYLQERVGLHGNPFTVYKFRSMREDAEYDGKARWASKGDNRVTRVGRFLRKSRLDELPQVINVLKGEMSIVGPRPERQQFIDELQQQIPFYRTRLAAKPGLTGWAQVSYGYGSSVEDAMVKLQYDLYYLKHQSPWFDANIILRTVAVVLRMKGQ